ncbi:DNA polymerase III subunit delta' [Agaribacterium sp. ZY112]|uniref:DNA polymerase III subunit delta' n=1 Tax=Agaribacterium sp. ZY112 TaxID=3233574 RepID=UPI0035266BAF
MIPQTAMPPYPWQESLWAGFCQSLEAGRLPHAILLNAVDGLGIEELGQAMARFLLCHSPIDDLACGRCRGCELLHAGSHPDFFLLKPEEKATQIKVDQVRDCVDFVAKTSHFDGPKLVLIEQAESMNVNASNALLKSLEEPAGRCIFILVSDRVSAILPTIRSRCQCMTLSLPSTRASEAWLKEQGLENAQHWLRQAGGAPLKAKKWTDGDYAESQLKLWAELSSLARAEIGAIALAASWQSRETLELMQMQLFMLESLLRFKMAKEPVAQELQALVDQLAILEEHYFFRLHDKLSQRLAQLQRGANLNGLLQCEDMVMDWQSLFQLARRMNARQRRL